MASHLHDSHRQPTNDQFELVVNETIPMEQPTANPGFPAAPTMNITRRMRVNTGDTIDVERVICVNQRYLVPVDLPQMTVQLPYGDIHPFRSACGSNEQPVPLSATKGDLGMQNVFNDQTPLQYCYDTPILRAPASETLMKALESYQQYAGCPLPPVSIQPLSAPSKHLEPKEFTPNQTENSFATANGEITNSRNNDFNGCNGLEATNGSTDFSGVISRKNFNLNIKISGSDSPLQTTTYMGNFSHSPSPVQQIEQNTNEVHKDGNDLVLVLKKELSNSDVANLGRIVLPKREAEMHFPNLDDKKMALVMAMEDLKSDITWEFKFRFWPNNKSRMYVLEHTGEFVRTHRLQVGDILMIFKNKDKEKYMVSHEKNEASRNPGGRLKHGKRRTLPQNMLQPFQGERRPLSNPTQTGAQQIIRTQVAFPPFFAASPFVRPEDLSKLMP